MPCDKHEGSTRGAEPRFEHEELQTSIDEALSAAGIGLWTNDLVTGIVRFDTRFQARFDLPERERYADFLSRVPPEDRPRIEHGMSVATRPDGPGRFEATYRLESPRHGLGWLLARGRCTFEHTKEGKRPVRLSGVVQDVTRMKEAELELREREAWLDLALEAGGIGTFSYEGTGPARCSAIYRALLGFDANEPVTLEAFLQRVHPDDRQRLAASAPGEMDREGRLHVGYRIIRPDGQLRWIEATLRGIDGPSRVIGVVRDVTEAKQAERNLRTAHDRLSLALEAADIAAWEWDLATGTIAWDARALRIFGLDGPPVVDLAFVRERVHPEDRAAVDAVVARARTSTQPNTYQVEPRIVRADGTIRWLLVKGRTQFEQGAQARFVGIGLDITERKQYEQAMVEAARQKDQFLATLGHELRNPVAAISHAGELLRMLGVEDPRLQRLFAIIQRQTGHMTRLLDELLDVSRITRGKIQLQRSDLDLRDVVVEVTADLHERFARLGLDLRVSAPDSLPVHADPTRMAQVLTNLLDNAKKFTESPGRVWVRALREGSHAVLEVEDTGIGFDPAEADQLLLPFRQGGPTLQQGPGLGLGLALVKGLVELHGGAIEATSEGHGRGARFRVRLPLRRTQQVRPEARRQDVGAIPRRRVLVVDDNRDSAEVLRDTLELLGHDAAVAYDGPEALRIASRYHPTTVLCDIGLPDPMNGYDVARAFRHDETLRTTRLIAVTGYGRPEDRESAQRAGFDLHMTKPVRLDQLQAALVA